MVIEQSEHIISEVRKAFIGKDEIIKKVLMTIYAGGHVLLEDCPGVGKTTLALAFSRALGIKCTRVQFTTDTLPSDITGYTALNRQTGEFEYIEGAANCNLLLADEINRTSPKTQAALLEVMEERTVTVDGKTHRLEAPFICIATQNPYGMAGTQPLPESQLDRFMVELSIGYPSAEGQIQILKANRYSNPLDDITPAATKQNIAEVQNYLSTIKITDEVLRYAIELCEATREHDYVQLGVSPRGIIALSRMAKANAIIERRNYVTPWDIRQVFKDVCAHRLILNSRARLEGASAGDILEEIMQKVKPSAEGIGRKNA